MIINNELAIEIREWADKYETAYFISSDPVQFPRRYSWRDAEVSGVITSWLSFGNRKAIIGAAERMDREFGGSPYGWLMDRQYVKVYNYLKYNDMKIQVELNLEDVFNEAMYNEATLKEEFTSSVRLAVVRELKEKFKNELMREISNPISEKIEDIARESISDLIENASEKKYRFRLDYMDDELTVDEFIRGRMKKVVDGGIGTMIESRAKSFVDELRKRYDMAFATFIVDNMRKQNMLKDEKIAELLKIIQMRGRKDAKKRLRSVLMTPAVPERVILTINNVYLI